MYFAPEELVAALGIVLILAVELALEQHLRVGA